MSPPVLCIDFGSAYTKVALRPAPDRPAELLSDPSLNLDRLNICVPSVVVVDRTGSQPRAQCGVRACDRVAGEGIEVYRNWKSRLFADLAPAPEPPLSQFLAAPETRDLARRYGVADSDFDTLLDRVRGGVAVATSPPADMLRVAKAYFTWLLQFVSKAFQGSGTSDATAWRARLCVPAFRGATGLPPGLERLQDVLREAGWTTDPERPLVTEPFANAVGALTSGVNRVWRPRGREGDESVHLGEMFGHGPLMDAYREGRPEHNVLLIDVGAYTTDFALLRFDTREDPDAPPEVTDLSEQLGIDELDRRVQAALPEAKGRWLAAAAARRREECKNRLYTEGQPYRTTEVGQIGTRAEMTVVRGCIEGFADEAVGLAARFLAAHPAEVHELILTGGGNHVPVVRDRLRAGLHSRALLATHIPLDTSPPNGTIRALSRQLARGASALGGASVFFDQSFH
jgi:hypothetical protein